MPIRDLQVDIINFLSRTLNNTVEAAVVEGVKAGSWRAGLTVYYLSDTFEHALSNILKCNSIPLPHIPFGLYGSLMISLISQVRFRTENGHQCR